MPHYFRRKSEKIPIKDFFGQIDYSIFFSILSKEGDFLSDCLSTLMQQKTISSILASPNGGIVKILSPVFPVTNTMQKYKNSSSKSLNCQANRILEEKPSCS